MSTPSHAAHSEHSEHSATDGGLRAMAASATLHCLTGCAIGEILGLVIGTAVGLASGATVALSIGLAFVFGYTLSSLPLVRSGLTVAAAMRLVLAADTVSILTMEVVDNLVVVAVPGAMNAGLVNATFWLSMSLALVIAYGAAYPVNLHLLRRGKGHALTHGHHGSDSAVTGARRLIPVLPTPVLAAAIGAFMLGGLVVSLADQQGGSPAPMHAAEQTVVHRS